MGKIKVGDTVRVRERPDWPSAPGYRIANSVGKVTSIKEAEGFITIRLVKTNVTKLKGCILDLRLENVQKV